MTRQCCAANQSGRTALEALLIVVAVSLLLIAAADRFYSSVRPIKETALRVELANLRGAVTTYALFNGRLPPGLSELARNNIVIPKHAIEGKDYAIEIGSRYVEGMTVDKDGNLLDPFGAAYKYDPVTGRINSASAGHETW
ncbi:MAG: hypothetical protein HY894_01330 [Deltaproteobacteria bacterium]|nr:hypothetical protein [Deltaproteobacteria bacterium]